MSERPASRMYATIHREPDDLRALLAGGWDGARQAAGVVGAAERVFTVGIGTSYHAALNAQHQLRIAGCDARAVSSFDFVHFPPALREDDCVIAFAHRGTKRFSTDAIARVRERGLPIVVVTGIGSAVEDADLVLRTTVQEESAAFTASHSGAMFVTAQIACCVAEERGGVDAGLRAAFERMPGIVQSLLGREDDVAQVARESLHRRIYCVGSGPDEALALECSLKSRETAYTTIDGMATEQFIHGPMVTVNPDDYVIAFATAEAGRPRVRELLAVLDRIGTPGWVIGRVPEPPPGFRQFEVEDLHPFLAPIAAAIPVQLLACYHAHIKGTNADSFRRDVSPHREAFSLITL